MGILFPDVADRGQVSTRDVLFTYSPSVTCETSSKVNNGGHRAALISQQESIVDSIWTQMSPVYNYDTVNTVARRGSVESIS